MQVAMIITPLAFQDETGALYGEFSYDFTDTISGTLGIRYFE